tara:strand:- start:173 stop:385 length:213 start_codon:yes stop_codon:yes gene_type:complete
MTDIIKHREELSQRIESLLHRLEFLSNVWERDKSDENVWFEAAKIMGEVAPLVEEFKQEVQLETGETYLN